ncbi:MAG: 3'(2'),5'-bisphosphate nucleotidase CysQ [Hyphomicrobium sp.]|nr:3'(2'),5'-bisphosphate nucleotidase CysQ [Hyphomicrobium sp.]
MGGTMQFPGAIDGLVQLALAAGREIMALRPSGRDARAKTDGSPVTAADEAAERIITAGLAELFPRLPVVAEERVAADDVPTDLGSRFVLVDPLDGTKEFVDGRPEFTVNIAIVENGAPVTGVIVAPAMGEGFAGGHGTAWAFRCDADGLRDVETIRARPRASQLAAVVSRSHATPETLGYLEQFAVAEQLSYGSSLKLAKIAEGKADIYPRLGRTMEWDIAAGDAILRAAGGFVTTLDGQPMTYGKMPPVVDAPFANPYFVAFGAWPMGDISATFARKSDVAP